MIISASRRTDIPSFYSTWFFNRIREGYVLVPNPFNARQVSRVRLTPEVVDGIVFWTKNPAPMLEKLDRLKEFPYYVQFTLNAYDREIEARLPSLEQRIGTFRRLADKIGKEKVIWRYDPVFLNEKYNVSFHKSAFEEIAGRLEGYTERCMLGFIDPYRHIQRTMKQINILPATLPEIGEMAASFKSVSVSSSMSLYTCTVKVDLSGIGIPAGKCIDKQLIERIAGYPIVAAKDRNQRDVCRCIESIDIGSYDTCLNGCIYCYANTTGDKCMRHARLHNPTAPRLFGEMGEGDIIRDRPVKSWRSDPSLF